MAPRRKPAEEVKHSCANCKHRFVLDHHTDAAECRRAPMVYIAEIDDWACPPAPADFLCGEHLIKYNS